ncbi:YidC/Oxa1 family membrane protein insertase [Actinokineospora baliensis]|uniref:membrane protein insertase YidC n=1 Tax=Actinokineospora baliensis TaxID=547056 RepID=UPI00195DF901|nr:membrane protein insertase YidC [Actinokineospora baliensis]MBM7771036.1 YidC/Oxa1 family membrane protein insertase [Actinokineospora baliensis]
MLDFIYYPVSFIMWCWHWVFGHVFGESSAIAWALSIVFLVFTLRAIMFKPTVKQVRSMRKMQEFAPEIKKLQKKYANDRQKQAQEMQKLQAEHGVSPLGGCLPMLLQIPVFIGLFHVLREFKPGKTENYFFDERGVTSYIDANLFGARLSNWITQPATELAHFGVTRTTVVLVAIPLMLLASALTHLTARHSVSRQNPEAATSQTAIMNKLTLYIFPLGVLLGGFFFPIGLIMYWLSNNSWTLWQQRFVYKKVDAEEAAKKAEVQEKRAATAPKPGQKPTQQKKRPAAKVEPSDTDTTSDTTAPDSTTPPAKPTQPGGNGTGGTQIPGLISDRSRSKKSGRKNR